MKAKNLKSLETLTLFTHYCGTLSVFIGLTVVFIDVLNSDFKHMQVGLYVFVTGYAFAKISRKLTSIVYDESKGE